jgi:hypothetical protein
MANGFIQNTIKKVIEFVNGKKVPQLPYEIHVEILQYFSFKELFLARGVCITYYELCIEQMHKKYLWPCTIQLEWMFRTENTIKALHYYKEPLEAPTCIIQTTGFGTLQWHDYILSFDFKAGGMRSYPSLWGHWQSWGYMPRKFWQRGKRSGWQSGKRECWDRNGFLWRRKRDLKFFKRRQAPTRVVTNGPSGYWLDEDPKIYEAMMRDIVPTCYFLATLQDVGGTRSRKSRIRKFFHRR